MPVPFYLKQGDTARAIEQQLGGIDPVTGLFVPQNLTGCTVRFSMRSKATGAVKINRALAVVTDALTGKVKYVWQGADVDTAGDFEAEWVVIFSGGEEATFPAGPGADAYVLVRVRDDVA